ncbi:hypothetical protein GLW08_08180 [Pontibacillus yanchengensis]|uniref:Uncharacterized protein n=1 Tax=Pontibacillus yanchengensis TaxID=462910 RepID=A0ACC7VF64_9BACI|nr:hypothetical protein [Pontibacillus yanchengensis]MYL53315.1 hypothetical protein [Pontibacillus yanchengensis]
MAEPKNLEQALKQYHGIKDKETQAAENIRKQKADLQTEIADLENKLAEHQRETTLDISDKALQTETDLKQQITSAKLKLQSLQDKEGRLSFGRDTKAIGKKAVEFAKQEKKEEYDEKLPGVLDAIEKAKRDYLLAVVAYRDLENDLKQGISDVGLEVNHQITNDDFPRVREIAWGYRDHQHTDGEKYAVSEADIQRAVKEGKFSKYE